MENRSGVSVVVVVADPRTWDSSQMRMCFPSTVAILKVDGKAVSQTGSQSPRLQKEK